MAEEESLETKVTLAQLGRVFRLNHMQYLKQSAPRVIPKGHFEPAAPRTRKKGRRSKTYGVLVPSSQCMYLDLKDCDSRAVHLHQVVPHNDSEGGVDLTVCRRLLMENWSEESKALLKATGRTDAPLRVFDLNILGLKVIACPDPRPDAWRKHDSKIRVTEWLVEEDNQVAIALTMADCNFDVLQLRDIFGPILVTRHPFDRDLKLKHLSGHRFVLWFHVTAGLGG